jgi:phosphoglycerate dehydrogenase-like enzyme
MTVPSNRVPTGKAVVAVLDLQPPDVQAIIAAQAPPEISLQMATNADPDTLHALAAEADIIVGGISALPAALIEASPHLKLIHKWGIGVDKIDLEAARQRGVPVLITAGENARAVSEHTVLLMLTVLRHLPQASIAIRAGDFHGGRGQASIHNRQLVGKTIGLIGMGNVGRQVARRLRPFEVELTYFDILRPTPEEEQALGLTFRPLEELIEAADIVSLHVPFLPETHHMLSRERISRLKPGAIVINTARGELIDEQALAEAIRAGRISGAGLDVFAREPIGADHPLLAADLPNVIVTPHIAGAAIDNAANMAAHIFANVRRVLNNEPLPAADIIIPASAPA